MSPSTEAPAEVPRNAANTPPRRPQTPAGFPRGSLLNIWVLSLFLKGLLVVGYHSTDFDVHRNWLAITNKLPMAQWYTENTSQWTLDYPPFFAYFECALSQLVPPVVAADGCLDIVEVGQYGLPTVYFQRASVMATEAVLFLALQWYVRTAAPAEQARAFAVALSLILSPGLVLIDHMHFQYNGMMYGLLVLMINCARLEKHVLCGLCFAVLLCFKHIYLYLAPAVFIYLLRAYTLNLRYDTKRSALANGVRLVKWRNLLKLGATVAAVFGVAFAPFIYHGVMPQLVLRLFPFSRGLTHAYWAPNIWAVYSFLDRVLLQAYRQIPLAQVPLQKLLKLDARLLDASAVLKSGTRGLVGDVEFVVLPEITPKLTFMLTLFYQVMALIPLFIQPTYERFLGALTLCAYASFLFGWHVHEKAILLVIFPLSFLMTRDKRLLSLFNLVAACGYVSLFPLIFTCEEWLVKVVFTTLWYLIYYFVFRKVVRIPTHKNSHQAYSSYLLLDRVSSLYILGLIPVTGFVTLIDVFELKLEVLEKMAFLKLMIVSVYCAAGIISSWNGFNWLYFVDESIWDTDT
ncbi:ALG6, ALG8 glycosyltransferase [Metschnikowia bicuspidata var. bicuspidata NRRL YB-4993]|uniref:Alpha-1,3-glucosyltransferase n=1 Tax=Metschnikowia bicuspidata var. bicuspidata NRRL YB-4993 TaxID=869754 RepID=A0A1A0HDE4_9ASCO|nr:ALG6, ALG8 glycosyltransferase [Metschnikowia bicuspidata var. bicuspidata NRRL YB-4993]OBA21995.1 ALG6, ALG8 glycosyltransferase [Metschnikowia bicuspidata var. bicuspidata NRRL YB-4993]